MAVGRYVLNTNTGIDAKATAFEGQVNITKAEVIGSANESALTNAPATKIASPNTVMIEVTGTTTGAITTAAGVVGGVDLVPGTLV
jgi:hypothetical protein